MPGFRRLPLRLGVAVATPAALELLANYQTEPDVLIARQKGAWGAVDEEDATLNDVATLDGGRVLSAYAIGTEKIWIITEADRSATTLLLPSVY